MATYTTHCGAQMRLLCDDDIAAWDLASEELREMAGELAFEALHALTAGIYPNCPVTVRPCNWRICHVADFFDLRAALNPCICGENLCDGGHSYLELYERIAEVTQVWIDGVLLPPENYKRWRTGVVRLDSLGWPETQDITLPLTELGSFGVTYIPGMKSNIGELALGLLAVEYLKFCNGDSCRISSRVTEVNRGGARHDLSGGPFPTGFTNILAVDTFIRRVNPHGIKMEFSVAGRSHGRDS